MSCGNKEIPQNTVESKTSPQATPITEMSVHLTADQMRIADVQFGKVEMKTISSVVKVNGMLDVPPQNLVAVSPRLGGFVVSTPLLEGLKVRKGQVLAVLENQDFIILQQDFLEAKHRLEFAEAEYKRQAELNKENINALKTFQQTTADYRTLQTRTAALEQRLRMIGVNTQHLLETNAISRTYAITAQTDGFVTQVNVTIGKFVTQGEVLCRIVNTNHLHAELQVFEKDVPMLREGQRVRVVLVNEATERLARVYLIGREISENRTVRVHAHFDHHDAHLLPNTAIKALIELGDHSVTAVPESAIVNSNGNDFILVADEDDDNEKPHNNNASASRNQEKSKHEFYFVEIRKGAMANGFCEITLPASFDIQTKKIVVKGAYSVLSAYTRSTEAEGEEEHQH